MFNSIARFVEQSLDDLEAQGRSARPSYTDNSRGSSDYGLNRSINGAGSTPSAPSTPTSATNGARRVAIPAASSNSSGDNASGPISPPAGFGSLGGAAAWFGPSSPSSVSAQTPLKAASKPTTARTSSDFNVEAISNRGPSSRPSSSAGIALSSSNHAENTKRTSNDGFPAFPGLSNLKRSLSGIPLGNLDLTSLRNSLDMNMNVPGNSSNLTSPVTPSRDSSDNFTVPFPMLGSPGSLLNANKQFAATIARNISQGLNGAPPSKTQRRHSARAASMSSVSGFDSLTGPFSPHTMHQQDPFFFASLQGLPDELKTAAFTPLPKEDEDEELDQIHAELTGAKVEVPVRAVKQAGLGIGVPQNKLKSLHTRSLSSGNRPTSAPPGSTFSLPAQRVSTPPLMMRSPLAEATPSLLQHVLQEVDESPSNHTSVDNTPRISDKPFEGPQAEIALTNLMPNKAAIGLAEVTLLPVDEAFTHSLTDSDEEIEASLPERNDVIAGYQAHSDSNLQHRGDNAQKVNVPKAIQAEAPELQKASAHLGDRNSEKSQQQPNITLHSADRGAAATSTSLTSEPAASPISGTMSDSAQTVSQAEAVVPDGNQITEAPAPPAAPIINIQPSHTQEDFPSHPLELPNSGSPSRSVSPVPSSSHDSSTIPYLSTVPTTVAPAVRKSGSLADRLARAARAPFPLPRKSTDEDRPDPALLAEAKSDLAVRPPHNSTDAPVGVPASLQVLLQDLTPFKSVSDLTTLEAYLKKAQNASSDSIQVDALRNQLQVEKQRFSNLESEANTAKAATLRAEAKSKDEEEKKVKSISLLKAVRQKLIKAEKDKEEAEIMRDAAKEAQEQYGAEVKSMRQRYEMDTINLRTSQEQQLSKLKASFDREVASMRSTYEREAAARRGQFDQDLLNMRSLGAKEVGQRDSRIATLEASLTDTRREKDNFFKDAEAKQAALETAVVDQQSARTALEELRYELKESLDRNSVLQEEVAGFKRARLDLARDDTHTRRLLAEAESSSAESKRKYEQRIEALERERGDQEDQMAKQLQDKLREVERMRRELEQRDADDKEEKLRRDERQQTMERSEALIRQLQEKVAALDMLLMESREEVVRSKDDQLATQELLQDALRRLEAVNIRLEDSQSKETQLRMSNKTMRDELRKLQSGVLLAEKSRNPGIGYFSSFSNVGTPGPDGRSPPFSPVIGTDGHNRQLAVNGSELREAQPYQKKPDDADAASQASNDDERALNFEYIRNVILQFLEHKEMRPHLVSVLGVILQFTPAEIRRLSAKAAA